MYISEMDVENYRTFRKLHLCFDSRGNYIVGDNNIGKSNLLSLLRTMTHGYGFMERDFMNPDHPIRICLTLSAADEGTENTAHICLTQHVREVVPHLTNGDTGQTLPLEYLRCLFYIGFPLENVPRKMLNEGKAQEILTLYHQFFCAVPDFCEKVEKLLSRMGMTISFPEDPKDAALMFFHEIFGDDPREMSYDNTIKFMIAVGSLLLVKMAAKKNSRAISFEDMVVTNSRGKRYLPIIISIDEPELHLHPYMQRAVLAFFSSVLNNEEPLFLEFLQRVLGIDGLDGQLFVVTHSTDSLINDYRQIIRMYWDETKMVQAACGASFRFDKEVEKHLIMHFPEVKEALYSRCTILVEGETEFGSFGYFAKTMGIHFDSYGICLINARGESSIKKIFHLLRRFHIPAVCLYDRDVIEEHAESPHVFYTDYVCYEMDVVKACLAQKDRKALDRVIAETENMSDAINSSLIKKAGAKLGLPKGFYPPVKLKNIQSRNDKALEFYYFAWLYGNKGVIVGRALGEHLSAADIPPAFSRVILAAVRYSSSK